MTRYIARRILIAVPTLLGITMIIFLAMRILPGDVASAMFSQFGSTRLSDADRATLEKRPWAQPSHSTSSTESGLRDISTLKLGESFWRGDKVIDLVKKRGILTLSDRGDVDDGLMDDRDTCRYIIGPSPEYTDGLRCAGLHRLLPGCPHILVGVANHPGTSASVGLEGPTGDHNVLGRSR